MAGGASQPPSPYLGYPALGLTSTQATFPHDSLAPHAPLPMPLMPPPMLTPHAPLGGAKATNGVYVVQVGRENKYQGQRGGMTYLQREVPPWGGMAARCHHGGGWQQGAAFVIIRAVHRYAS